MEEDDTSSSSTNITNSPKTHTPAPSPTPTIDEVTWKPLEQRAMEQEDQMASEIQAIYELAQQVRNQSFETQPEPKPKPSLVECAVPAPKTPLVKNPRSPSPKRIPDPRKMAPKTPPKRPAIPPKRPNTPQLMPTAKWSQQPRAPQQATTPRTVHPVQGWQPQQATTTRTVHPVEGWGQPTPIPNPMAMPIFNPYAAPVAAMQAWPTSAAPSHFAQPPTIPSTASSSSRPVEPKPRPEPKPSVEHKSTGWKNKLVFFTQHWNNQDWTTTDRVVQLFDSHLQQPATRPLWGPGGTETSTAKPGHRTWKANAMSLVDNYKGHNWHNIHRMIQLWSQDGHFAAMVRKDPNTMAKPDWWQGWKQTCFTTCFTNTTFCTNKAK